MLNDGGSQTCDGNSITINGANSVTLMRLLLPWRTPLPESQAWSSDPANPDFAGVSPQAKRATVQLAAKAYDPQWLGQLKADLMSLPADYAKLLGTHSAAWRRLFDRVAIDFGGSPAERAMSSEALLDKAQKDQNSVFDLKGATLSSK